MIPVEAFNTISGVVAQCEGDYSLELSILRKCVELQIPKKPIELERCSIISEEAEYHILLPTYYCPVCNMHVRINQRHCECGQAILWESEE